MNPHKNEAEELRVEHVLAALDQIAALCAQVRSAMDGLDPKMALKSGRALQGMGPGSKQAVAQCNMHE